MATFQDITERKQAQQKIIASKSLLEAVFNASPISIVVTKSVRNDQEEIIDFEYQLVNRVVEKKAGRNLIGRRVLELYPNLKTTGLFEDLKTVVERGNEMDVEKYYEEEGFHNLLRVTAVKLGDGYVVQLEDIREGKQEEKIEKQK